MQPPLRPAHAPRFGSIRRGPLLAAAAASLALIVCLVLVSRAGRPAQAPRSKPTTPVLSTVPDLSSSLSQGPQGATLAQGDRFFLQFADRDDPTRLAGDVTAQRSVPKGERRYELTQPRAWFFLADGRSIHVEAASGLLTVARQTAGVGGGLENGSLVGDVVVRLFAARADATRPEPTTDKAIGVLRTSRLSIDWVLGQFDAPEDFDLAWQTLAYSGRGVLAQFDPQTRVLDSLAIASTREVTISEFAQPAAPQVQPPTTAAAPAAPAQPATPTPSTQPSPPQDTLAQVESFYAISSPANVRISRDQATLEAPNLRGGVRLINGELPKPSPTPAAPPPSRGTELTRVPTTQQATASAPSPAPSASTPPVNPAPTPTRIILAGPLEVRRLLDPAPPAELARDDWWAKLGDSFAARSTPVIARDPSRGLELHAATATILGTRGLLTLEASTEQPVTLRSDQAGTLTAERVEADRANQSVRVVGAGTLVGVAKQPSAKARADQSSNSPSARDPIASLPPAVRWDETATFQFARAQREFERLEQAHFVGDVESAADGSTVTGGQMVVEFAVPSTDAATPQLTNALVPARARVLGQATVADATGNRAQGDVLAVEFATDPQGRSTPARFDVQGQASAEFDAQTLRANSIRGTLARKPADPNQANASGAVELASMIAIGEPTTPATFNGKDGIAAEALTITASPADRTATLQGGLGQPARVRRVSPPDDRDRSSEVIGTGPVITLREADRIIVLGEGGEVSFAQRVRGQPMRELAASSIGPIAFNEASGVATLRESVEAKMSDRESPTPREARLLAHEVTVRFQPTPKPTSPEASQAPSPANSPAPPVAASPGFEIVSIEARAESGAAPVLATIQEFAANSPQAAITYHIEAPHLLATAADATFEATGTGRLLATRATRDDDASRTPSPSRDPFASAGAGDTLLSWRDSMRYANNDQRAFARGLVRLAHRDSAQAPPSLLECETLTVDLAAPPAVANASSASQPAAPAPTLAPTPTLRQALAEGGVWGSVQSREFTAARAIFDALASRIDAFGDASSTVVVAASAGQAPIAASRIRIDTATGRIEVIDPGTIQATQPESVPQSPPNPR